MPHVTFDEVIQTVQALTREDRHRLQEWLEEQARRDGEEERRAAAVRAEMEKYQQAKQWLAAHRTDYLGEWVALDGDRLLSHGPDARAVHQAAKDAGQAAPYVVRVVAEQEPFYAGWE